MYNFEYVSCKPTGKLITLANKTTRDTVFSKCYAIIGKSEVFLNQSVNISVFSS